MNKHFEDAWYYLGRAFHHLRIGLEEELAPLESAMRERFGWEEPEEGAEEQTRLDRFRTELRKVDTTEPVQKARERIDEYRRKPAAE
ncbi:DUF7553 family protein [Salinigranum marinum]|uniref:DUF7553 family protein n=1 Tax=Salinigranum marinum TaxID=1515595 RepID=UPI002989AAD6|nr:hypothetical protein [Salinigranum marinum]